MTETQERFLRAVAERLPLDRVAEVHLFPSIRQGGVETGVAVIAVEAPADAGADDHAAPAAEQPGHSGVAAAGVVADAPVPVAVAPGLADVGSPAEESEADVPGHATERPTSFSAVAEGEGAAAAATELAGGAADGVDDAGAPPRTQATTAAPDLAYHAHARRIDAPPTRPAPPAPRHTIFSARYRLTIKGPDRGRWEADVVAEADAPLATADAVVRGVRKRTGEAAEAERVSPELLRQLVAQPA